MLTKVRIENFKSFEDSAFELAPFTMVVGANGAGKSNFFDALRFLRFVGAGTSVRDAIEGHATSVPSDLSVPGIRGGSAEVVRFGSPKPIFRISVSIKTPDDRIAYKLAINVQTYRVVEEELRSSVRNQGSYIFSTHPEAPQLTQDPESPVISARFYKQTRGPNPKRDFSPHTSILSQFRGRLAESNLNEAVAEAVRTELASITPLELRPEILRQYAPLGTGELGEHGENFPAVVWMLEALAEDSNEEATRFGAIRSWMSELTPRTIESITTAQAPTGEVIFAVREEPYDQLITARSLSDGTLRFAALAVAILGSGQRGTVLIEELENGIHPARLQLLLRMIESYTTENREKQVIASTHSPAALDLASPGTIKGALVIAWDQEHSRSRVTRLAKLSDFQRQVEKRPIGELQAEGWIEFAADV